MNGPSPVDGTSFPSTHWSSIHAAGEKESDQGTVALERLLRRYQTPIRTYIRDKFRCDEHRAEDLFQGFVSDVVLKRNLIGRAQQAHGHLFRSFLLSALRNYVTSQVRKEQCQRRSPQGGFEVLEELDDFVKPGTAFESRSTPFDVSWARGVLAEALKRMKDHCETSGNLTTWEVFEQRLRRPILDGAQVRPYQELVSELEFSSPIQAQNALVTAKRMFARALRSVVGEYVTDPTAVEVEVRELQVILANQSEA